jgi:hypothetical protein
MAEEGLSALNWQTIIIATIGLFGTLITTLGTVFLARINANSKITKEASLESAEQSKQNSIKIDEVHTIASETHAFCNRPFGLALDTAASALEAVAEMSGKPEHVQAAMAARKRSDEHNQAMKSFEEQQARERAKAKESPSR